MGLVLPAALVGRIELRNEEVLLPQDARELHAHHAIKENFGNDMGNARTACRCLVSKQRDTCMGVPTFLTLSFRDGQLDILFEQRRHSDGGVAHRNC